MRISDWSSDVCSSDLDVWYQLIRFRLRNRKCCSNRASTCISPFRFLSTFLLPLLSFGGFPGQNSFLPAVRASVATRNVYYVCYIRLIQCSVRSEKKFIQFGVRLLGSEYLHWGSL